MGRAKHIGFWESLRAYPPIFVRISARCSTGGNNRRALSSEELAISSDIPLDRIHEISTHLAWDEITVGEAERFCKACNFDPTNPAHIKRQREYARSCLTHPHRIPFLYLRRSPWWVTEFKPLVELMANFQQRFVSESRASRANGSRADWRTTHA